MFGLRIGLLTLLSLVVCGVPAVAQQSALTINRVPSETVVNRFGLTRGWWGQATTNPGRDKILYISLDEDNLYVQSSSGVISAFDNESGKQIWAVQVGGTDRSIYPATSNADSVFVINGTSLFSLQKSDGATRWDLKLPGSPSSPPAADATKMFIGFLDGSLYAFDLKKIDELHKAGLMPQWSYQCVLWRYKTAKSISAPAIPYRKLVAFASQSGTLYSVGAEERNLVFQFETDAALSAPMARYKNNLLIASEDFNFYSVNMDTGKFNWQFSSGLAIRKAPLTILEDVFLMPDRGGLYKLSAERGTQIWWRPKVEEVLAVSPKRVFCIDQSNKLLMLSRANGSLNGVLPMDRFSMYAVNDRSDRIYMATTTGLIVCLHERELEFPVFHLHPEVQPIMPEFTPEGMAPADKPEAEGDEEKPEMEGDAEKPEMDADAEKPEMDADEKPKKEGDASEKEKEPGEEKS